MKCSGCSEVDGDTETSWLRRKGQSEEITAVKFNENKN
jgi:hypothetical protein